MGNSGCVEVYTAPVTISATDLFIDFLPADVPTVPATFDNPVVCAMEVILAPSCITGM